MKQKPQLIVSAVLCYALLIGPTQSLDWLKLPAAIKPLPADLVRPSTDTIQAIEDLPLAEDISAGYVHAGQWELPKDLTAGADVGADVKIPLAEDIMILSLDPAIGSDVYGIVEDYDLQVLSVSPETAQLTVKFDFSKYYQPRSGELSNETISRALLDAMNEYQSIPGVEIAAPSTYSYAKQDQVRLLESATLASPEAAAATGEIADWGVADIQADALWTMNGASNGTIFGVMDVGFGKHADLSYIALPEAVDDHGTHVAGVACAHHNEIGVRGVLPNCFVKAVHSLNIFEPEDEIDPEAAFVLFSLNEINQALVEFLDEGSDARTFNVSLGANWRRMSINPETDPFWRAMIVSQGATLARPLRLAAQAGKVVFSAAGNDSRETEVQSALYSSALNYAIVKLREEGLIAGLIVAAHDAEGARAPFSNAPADISCPGVDVLSTVAYNGGQQSDQTYGLMSGTSMATPYCASGYALLSLVLPNREPAELLRCMIESGERSGESVPRLKLLKAYGLCSSS